MNFHVLTLFPEMIENGMNTSITGRAIAKGLLTLEAINIRDFAFNKHNKVDDYPYGGGAGMLMQAEPVYLAYESIEKRVGKKPRVVYLTPQGQVFNQKMAREMALEENLVFLCGHYEGIDERVLEEIVTDYVSIGDYVLTGGELPAMVMMDSISRMVPGVLNNEESGETESFAGNLLEHPQYSRPEEWHGKKVPEVLMSGHHANIEKWRREQSIYRTALRRPDLLKNSDLTNKEWNYVRQLKKQWKEEAEAARKAIKAEIKAQVEEAVKADAEMHAEEAMKAEAEIHAEEAMKAETEIHAKEAMHAETTMHTEAEAQKAELKTAESEKEEGLENK